MHIEDGLELLDEAEALRLLALGEVGRVGLTIGALPAIFPVNYQYVDGVVIFRSAAGSKVSAASRGAVVAFEVDDYNTADQTGWSVLIVGPSEVVDDDDELFKTLDPGPQPFADGLRPALVRIQPAIVSGRRIIHDIEDASAPPVQEPRVRSVGW